MLKFLILSLIAVIVFPLLFFTVYQKKVKKWISNAIVYGFLIAVVGLFMQDRFEPLFVVLVLFGLTFVFSVWLDRQSKRVEQTVVDRPIVEKASLVNANLPRWMIADRKETDGRRRVDGE